MSILKHLKAIHIPATKDIDHESMSEVENIDKLWVPNVTELVFEDPNHISHVHLNKSIGATWGETIEILPTKIGEEFKGSYWLWIDEEARVSSLRPKPNPLATQLAAITYPVLGNALLLNVNIKNGEHIDVEDGVLAKLTQMAESLRHVIRISAEAHRNLKT